MAVSWLVFDGAKGQIRMISVLATPARGRWVDQCLCALVSCCKVALCAIEETCQTEAHEGPSIATSDNSRGLPRLPEKPQTPSRRKTGRPAAQPKPPRCAQRARIIGLPQRRIALTNTHRGAQQSHRSRDSRVQPPKHQSQGLPEHRTR